MNHDLPGIEFSEDELLALSEFDKGHCKRLERRVMNLNNTEIIQKSDYFRKLLASSLATDTVSEDDALNVYAQKTVERIDFSSVTMDDLEIIKGSVANDICKKFKLPLSHTDATRRKVYGIAARTVETAYDEFRVTSTQGVR